MKVRGVVFNGPGQPYGVEELDLAAPQAGELLVRYTASGVCRSDLHVVDGDWSRPTPVVLGHEGAGLVEAVGAGVGDIEVGATVVLSWLVPCGTCRSCAADRPWLCLASSSGQHCLPDGTTRLTRASGEQVRQYLGIGTFAEAAVVPRGAAVELPHEVPPEIAALIGCGVATGVGAVLRTAQVQPGDVVVIVGCGGVGLAAVMAAVLAGAAEVIAVDREPAKLTAAQRAGATRTVLAAPSWPQELVGTFVDVALDCIGSADVVRDLADLVAPGGQVVLVGMTAQGTAVSVDGYDVPDRGLRLVGCAYGSTVATRDFPQIAQDYLAGRLPLDQLVDRRIGLADVPAALDALRDNRGLRAVIDSSLG